MGSVHPEINHGRRDLIKLGAAGMGVVLLGEQALAEPKKGVKFDEEYDVIRHFAPHFPILSPIL